MKAAIRTLAAIVLGLVVAFALLAAVEYFGSVAHPVPADFDSSSMEQMCEHVARFPQWVLAVSVVFWAMTAFVSTWLARWIGNRYASTVVGLVLMALLVLNISMLPYPAWFKVATLVAIPVAIVAGSWLAIGRKAPV
jgi:hypothetical protein